MRQGIVYVGTYYAGILTENPGGGYTFTYDEAYYSNPSLPAVSLTLPKKQRVYESPVLFPFFANMLSEGANREVQSKYHRVDAEDDFGILLATADCDTPGAVTVKRKEDE